jgi:hypothetical protein
VGAVVNINDVLDGHVGLELDCIDRLYLNAYVPNLQVGGQVVGFMTRHLGNPIPSPAIFEQIGNRFRREVKAFAAASGVPILQLRKPDRSRLDDRKLDHIRPYLERAEAEGRTGVVAIVSAQEYQWVFSARDRSAGQGLPSFAFDKEERRVGTYYFYIADAEFGPGFIKLCTYFPYPAKIWLNGHEWAKRQARRAGVAFDELANGFAACADPAALQAICDRLGPADIEAFFERWMSAIPTPLGRADRAAGYWWELAMRQVEVSRTRLRRSPASARLLRVARGRQRRHRPARAGRGRLRQAARPTHQAALPDAPVLAGHRGGHRLQLQAQPGQAVPQGREGAAHRDRHQQAVRHRRPRPAPPPPGARRAGACSERPSAYDRTCRPGLCHRLCALRAHPPALQV